MYDFIGFIELGDEVFLPLWKATLFFVCSGISGFIAGFMLCSLFAVGERADAQMLDNYQLIREVENDN